MASWYKLKNKGDAENMLEFCDGWMNIRQNRGGATIIFLNEINYNRFHTYNNWRREFSFDDSMLQKFPDRPKNLIL